jgi:hypothetical protein
MDQIEKTDSATEYTVKDNDGGSTLTNTVPTASSTYNYVLISDGDWPCASSTCAASTALEVRLTAASNPHAQSSDYTDFLIQIYDDASETNIIFTSSDTTPLDASPDLDYGAITSMSVTHGIDDGDSDTEDEETLQKVGEATDYSVTFTTSGDVPQNGYFKITMDEGRAVLSGDTFACVDGSGTAYTCSGALSSDKMVVSI